MVLDSRKQRLSRRTVVLAVVGAHERTRLHTICGQHYIKNLPFRQDPFYGSRKYFAAASGGTALMMTPEPISTPAHMEPRGRILR